jgi:hypothetical protein
MPLITDSRQFVSEADITPDSLNQRFRRLYHAVNFFNVLTITASAMAGVDDDVVLGDATAGAVTVTLPTAVGIRGRRYTIKKIDAGAHAVTIDGAGAETIDGAATVALGTQYHFRIIVSDGSNWIVIGS